MPLQRLIKSLSRLPGVGRRTAERMAYKLVLDDKNLIRELRTALEYAEQELCCCTICGKVTEQDRNPCDFCTSDGRENTAVCVVEEPGDIQLIEQSGGFNGRYFCLMGKLSPMNQETITENRLHKLMRQLESWGTQEVILALNSDVESDATASYMAEVLSATGVKVSRLAFGIPAGSGLAYSDPVTLGRALEGRQDL